MNKNLIIVGACGHVISITNVALTCGFNVFAFVDDLKSGETLFGKPIISKKACIEKYDGHCFAIAIGDNAKRESVYIDFKSEFPNAKFPALIHQSSVIGLESTVQQGAVVMPFANVGPNSIVGDFCILNTHSSIDHDYLMGDFASLAPGVTSGGSVKIGLRSAISIGSVIKHSIEIGQDVVVGAHSYVNQPIDDRKLVYGTPAKTIRCRNIGDPYLNSSSIFV